jgi:hypothetical protein
VIRIRKAWRVAVQGCSPDSVVYAPTAAKARAQVIDSVRDAWGCSFKQALSYVRACQRAPERDIELPEQHPLAPQLSAGVLHCVVHAYGGTGLRAGYRDHFYADAGDWQMQAALYHGLFRVYRRDKGRNGQPDMVMYELTDLGRNVARGEAQTYPRF